jgi:hypothetical protein
METHGVRTEGRLPLRAFGPYCPAAAPATLMTMVRAGRETSEAPGRAGEATRALKQAYRRADVELAVILLGMWNGVGTRPERRGWERSGRPS